MVEYYTGIYFIDSIATCVGFKGDTSAVIYCILDFPQVQKYNVSVLEFGITNYFFANQSKIKYLTMDIRRNNILIKYEDDIETNAPKNAIHTWDALFVTIKVNVTKK